MKTRRMRNTSPVKVRLTPRDNPEFVAAVKATGRKTLIIAGTITSVCMAFPAIAAVADGYKVFAVIDASGTYSKMAQEITPARVVQAGVVPMDTAAVASELQRTSESPGRRRMGGGVHQSLPGLPAADRKLQQSAGRREE